MFPGVISDLKWACLAIGTGLFIAACSSPSSQTPQSTASASGGQTGSLTNAAATGAPSPAGEWHMASGDYAGTRYSPLDEINSGNAGGLKVAWTFSTGMVSGHEAAPLVVGGTMYLVTPFPNLLYALDLTKPGAPVKWMFDPEPAGASRGVACCDTVNRGAVYWNRSVIFNTLDGRTISVDADTGEQEWSTSSATSTGARPSRWLRSSPTTKSSSATAAASSASADGWSASTLPTANWRGAPTRRDLTPTS